MISVFSPFIRIFKVKFKCLHRAENFIFCEAIKDYIWWLFAWFWCFCKYFYTENTTLFSDPAKNFVSIILIFGSLFAKAKSIANFRVKSLRLSWLFRGSFSRYVRACFISKTSLHWGVGMQELRILFLKWCFPTETEFQSSWNADIIELKQFNIRCSNLVLNKFTRKFVMSFTAPKKINLSQFTPASVLIPGRFVTALRTCVLVLDICDELFRFLRYSCCFPLLFEINHTATFKCLRGWCDPMWFIRREILLHCKMRFFILVPGLWPPYWSDEIHSFSFAISETGEKRKSGCGIRLQLGVVWCDAKRSILGWPIICLIFSNVWEHISSYKQTVPAQFFYLRFFNL